jgi:hypothetical protein
MTTKVTPESQYVNKTLGLSKWNADQLSRFCEVGYQMARRQFGARLNVIVDDPRRREEILEALMEETTIFAENLIVLALDYGHLNPQKLRQRGEKEVKKKGRTLILEDER